jgi:hypothetical protein
MGCAPSRHHRKAQLRLCKPEREKLHPRFISFDRRKGSSFIFGYVKTAQSMLPPPEIQATIDQFREVICVLAFSEPPAK